jgi:hypothetical protein
LALGVGFAVPAHPLLLDFALNYGAAGGSIGFEGSLNPLVGTNIVVSNVQDLDNPGLAPLVITGGLLNFSTGPFSGNIADIWQFGGGSQSSLQITGAVDSLGIPAGTTLLPGTFQTVFVQKISVQNQIQFQIAGAAFQDVKMPICSNTSALKMEGRCRFLITSISPSLPILWIPLLPSTAPKS